MKFRLCACLLVGALVSVTQAVAAPLATPFLSVDVNGYNAGGAESEGATQAGFEGWAAVQDDIFGGSWSSSGTTGMTEVFSTSEGDVTATLTGLGTGTRIARNRGGAGGAPLDAVEQDIAFMTRGLDGFGQNWIKLQLSGLVPGQAYEITGFAREPFNGGTASFQAWTDFDTLGGVDGPGAWMDANVGANAVYQPVFTDDDVDPMTPDVDTGYKNPIPTIARVLSSGPTPTGAYDNAATLVSTADAGGNIMVYTWADPDSYSGTQTATAFSGFQLGVAIPEPASLALVALGLCGLASIRRR